MGSRHGKRIHFEHPSSSPKGKKLPIWAKVLIVLAGVVLVAVGVVAMRPAEYRVTRSATIAAPPDAVFAQINDFHRWGAWSPWARKDPNATNTFEGPASGEGAVLKWSGNQDVGVGSMTIVESKPHERIRIRLDFVEPFEDTANVQFALEPNGNQTAVTWTINGKNNFIGKVICLFMDTDQMIGSDFEQGFANLKRTVETTSAN